MPVIFQLSEIIFVIVIYMIERRLFVFVSSGAGFRSVDKSRLNVV